MKLSAIQIPLVVLAGQTIAAVLNPRNNAMIERRGNDNGRYNFISEIPRNITRPSTQGPFHFHQNVDHQDPGSGTFLQRYWVKDTYYGWHRQKSMQRLPDNCPIFLIVGSEESGSDALDHMKEDSMILRMASENAALVVLLEHRYFGQSFPVENLSDDNMRYLTIEQILADLNHFATRGMGSLRLDLKPDKHPWVLIGASYGGGLVSWALLKYKKTFHAGYSSSGTVQAKVELWEAWAAIYARMLAETPRCAERLAKILQRFYDAAENADQAEIKRIRKKLEMSQIAHPDDMANILADPLTQYPWGRFYEYCDQLSNSSDALEAVGRWNKDVLRVDKNPSAWNSYDPQSDTYSWKNINLSSDSTEGERQWFWLKCNELGWFVTAPPSGTCPVISEYLVIERELRKCGLYFPTLKSRMTLEAITQRVEKTNERYGGFNKRVAYLVDVNGEYDPWLGATFRSPNAPEKYREVSFLIPGKHSQDLAERVGGHMDKVQRGIQRIMKGWLKEWSPPA